MARPVWTGSVSFGLVNLPVKLYTATENHDVSFHHFQRDTGERIKHKRVAEGSDEEVPYDDIVKGYEVQENGVLELIERKAQGERVVIEEPEEAGSNVVDLMAALEASISDARGRRGSGGARTDGSSDGGAPDDRSLDAMTREELYEEAQKRDIGGRSKMSKTELLDALQEAS